MRQERHRQSGGAEQTVRDIRRATRRRFSAEAKIRILLEGRRGEDSIGELCRSEVINHGDFVLGGQIPNPVKVGLTYMVPYCVATYCAVTAKRAAWRRQHGGPARAPVAWTAPGGARDARVRS